MLRPARMRRLTVGVHTEAYESCIAALQEAGAVELEAAGDVEGLQGLISPRPRSERIPAIATERARLERCIEALESILPETNPIREIFFPTTPSRVPVAVRGADAVLADAGRLHGVIERVLALKTEDGAIAGRLERIGERRRLSDTLLHSGSIPHR